MGKFVSYVPRKNKNVILVSSLHDDDAIDPRSEAQNKPEMITFYNETKSGVDTADQMCATFSVCRNVRRWPMEFHTNENVSMDIIGGKEATPHSRPYMAFIQPALCGGALIRPKWILTAAHCNVNSTSYAILGAHRLDDTHKQVLRIKQGIKHPNFKWGIWINDLQLLELEKPAKLNKFVALLPLPKNEEVIQAGKICSTAGWGRTDVKILSDVLLEVNLTIVGNEDCEKKYRKIDQPIISSMMCAGAPNNNRKAGTCYGDSGGPLICDGKYVGLVSFGHPNCDPEFPGGYTRLTIYYLHWIRNTINRDYSEIYTT
ncbi:granzyme A-like [Phyllobates terribilis]|uniref:granzyme A-like n=1 Tax=Phyllobates terribilis TaxID=111132 RepID=UPI003CCB6552